MSQKKTCRHCGKEFDIRGVRLHELACKKNPARQVQADHKKEKLAVAGCDCGDNADWRPLDGSDARHAQVMAQGYSEYCTVCEEIRM